MYPNDPQDKMVLKCLKYQMMADYYKYIDPARHIHYYQKHFSCVQQLMSGMHGQRQQPAMFRVLHASPNAPAVDVYANGNRILQNVSYKDLSDYMSVSPGRYRIDIFRAGQTARPILSQNVTLEPATLYTVAAAGDASNLRLIPAVDNQRITEGMAKVRFWHLSPDAPAVDIAIKGGSVLFKNISFGKTSDYIELPPATADVEVRIAGTKNVVKTIRNVTLRKDEAYTVAAVGFAGGSPGVEALFLKP